MSDHEEPAFAVAPAPLPAAAAVSSLIPFPKQLDMDGNIANNWKKFKRSWNNYEKASCLNTKPSDLRAATFLTCIGSEAMDVFDGFDFANDAEKEDITTIMDKFESFCVGKTNVTYERYLFHSCSQNDMTFDNFLTSIRKLAKTCNYGTLKNELITDRLVLGINDNSIRRRLLQEEALTLDKAIDICRAAEASQSKVKSLSQATGSSQPTPVEEVQVVKPKRFSHQDRHKFKCKYCNSFCKIGACPAYGKTCATCGLRNHFSVACPQKSGQKQKKRQT